MSESDIANRLVDLVRPFLDLQCVGGRLYLGSMFYLDFGTLFVSATSKGERIEIGEMTLSIRDVAWSLRHRGELIASAESIDPKQFADNVAHLVGTRVTDVCGAEAGGQLEIRLEREWLLIVDLTNQWDSDSDILQVSLPDGRILAVTETGVLDDKAGFDNERARNWAASPNRH